MENFKVPVMRLTELGGAAGGVLLYVHSMVADIQHDIDQIAADTRALASLQQFMVAHTNEPAHREASVRFDQLHEDVKELRRQLQQRFNSRISP